MADTISTLNAFTKEFYGDDWFLQYNPRTPLLAKEAKNKKPVVRRGGQDYLQSTPTGGRYFYIPAVFGGPESGAFIADGGNWPAAGSVNAVPSLVWATHHIHTVQLTAQVVHLLGDNHKAFANMMDTIMNLAKQIFHMDWATYLYGDSTGAIGVVKSVTGAGPYTVTLTTPADIGVTLGGTVITPDNVTNATYFRNGLTFTAATARSGGTARTGTGHVTNVDPLNPSGPRIVCDTIPTGLAAGDFIFTNALGAATATYPNGPGTTTTASAIMDGLLSAVDDGTYKATFQNISRSNNGLWKAVVDGNAGTPRPLSLDLIRRTVSNVTKMGGTPELIVSDYALRDQYIGVLQADVRFGGPKEYDGGFVGAPYSLPDGRVVQWVADQYSPYGRVWILDTDKLMHFEAKGEGWDDTTGGIWRQALASSGGAYAAAYVAAFQWLGNFGTVQPSAQGVIKDVKE